MKKQTTLKELFGNPWGILENRRHDLEKGYYGSFDKIFCEELLNHFCTIHGAAGIMGCHESTVRRWLKSYDCCYIVHDGQDLYLKTDIEAIKEARNKKRNITNNFLKTG